VLNFRKALTFIQTDFPFSFAFGPANNREACIKSAQEVYNRLLLHTPDSEAIKFDTLALLAVDDEGIVERDKAQALIKLFRPDRKGHLSVLDFVKSIDSVYKEFRLLNAAIENSSQIDRAFENIFNIFFYLIMAIVILSQLGFDPLSLFLSMSSIVLAMAWLIGPASAKYFEGLLFILVRRPYSIGTWSETKATISIPKACAHIDFFVWAGRGPNPHFRRGTGLLPRRCGFRLGTLTCLRQIKLH
jgi:hypothetical protein